jgi:aryl carrier-like protein
LEEIEHYIHRYFRDLTGVGLGVVVDLISARCDTAETSLVAFLELEAAITQKGYLADPGAAVLYNEMKSIVLKLDEAIRDVLPRYMVPSAYIPRWNLPMMPSGKLDRKQLRIDAESFSAEQWAHFRKFCTLNPAASQRKVATSEEITLQGLWADILHIGVEQINADDSFFTLGANSITAMKLVELARRRGFRLNVADVFTHPVLGDLAPRVGRVESSPRNNDDLGYTPLQQLTSPNPTLIQGQSDNIPLVMIHDGGGTTYAYHCMGRIHRPLFGIHYPGFVQQSPGGEE